jgi:acetyl esterase
LTGEAGQEFRAAYVGDSDPSDPRLSPLQGDLAKSPPAVIATAEYDILRDDGLHYAEQLEAAGVAVKHFHYPTLMHGFFGFGPLSEAANAAIDEICAAAVELAGAPATV